jgi:hypothetical protein
MEQFHSQNCPAEGMWIKIMELERQNVEFKEAEGHQAKKKQLIGRLPKWQVPNLWRCPKPINDEGFASCEQNVLNQNNMVRCVHT